MTRTPYTLVLDTECTGFARGDRVCQWAVATVDRTGHTRAHARYVDPGVPMNPRASRVTGITDAVLAGKPPMTFYARRLEVLLSHARKVVAHNAPFDKRMLTQSGVRVPHHVPWVDTLSLARRAWPYLQHHTLGYLREHLGLRVPEGTREHDALGDVFLTIELAKRLHILQQL